MSRQNLMNRKWAVAWCVWAALVVSAPPSLSPWTANPLDQLSLSYSNVYAFMAAGGIAGLCIVRAFERIGRGVRTLPVIAALGIVAGTVHTILSWLGAAMLSPDADVALWREVVPVLSCLPGLSRIAGHDLGSPSLWLAFAAGSGVCLTGVLAMGSATHEGRVRVHEGVAWLMLVAAFFRALAWQGLAPGGSVYAPFSGRAWGVEELCLETLIPAAIVLLGAFTTVLAARRANEPGRVASALLGLVCAGELLWRLVSRVALDLIVGLSHLWGVALAFQVLCVLALALLSLSRRATKAAPSHGDGSAVASDDSPCMDAEFSSHGLTPRETEVVERQLRGMTSAQIGEELGIGASTVRALQQRAYRRFHVANAVELRKVLESGGAEPRHERASTVESPKKRVFSVPFASLGLFVGAVFLLPFGLSKGQPASWTDGWVTPLSIAVGIVLGFAAGRFRGAAGRPHTARRGRSHLILSLVLLVPWAVYRALLSFSMELLPVCRVAATICLVISIAALCPGAPAPGPLAMNWEYLALLAVSVFIGVTFEEVWRASAWAFFSVEGELLPGMVVTCAALVTSVWCRSGDLGRLACLSTLGIGVVAVAAGQSIPLALLFVILVNGGLLLRLWFLETRGTFSWQPLLLGCACGVLGGHVLVSSYGDALSHLGYVGDVSGQLALRGIVALVAGSLALLTSTAFAFACRSVFLRLDAKHAVEFGRAIPDERYAQYFLARGLNQTQASVATLIVRGLTRGEIASQLHVSPGTVNSARTAVYRTLGVHGRQELMTHVARIFGV